MNQTGQVDIKSEFGQLLTGYAELPEIHIILEVGTWKGNGTTACIVEGIRRKLERKPDLFAHFFSIETNLKFLMEANRLWMPKALPFLQLLYGRLHSNGLLSRDDIEKDPRFESIQSHYNLWYDQDVRDYNSAPLIDTKYLPEKIQMILLDGGEFSGYADWSILKEKQPTVVALDDTNVMKNAKVFEELSKDPTWELRHSSTDRHGWAIFVRKVS